MPRAVLPHNEINHLVSSQPFAVPFRIELEVVRVGLNCDWEQSQLQLFVDQKLKEFRFEMFENLFVQQIIFLIFAFFVLFFSQKK